MTHDSAPNLSSFAIPADHPCLPGHFPGRPVVPGVVVLDRVFAAIEAAQGVRPGTNPAQVRLPQVKFVQPLLPEQAARIELERIESERLPTHDAPRWRFKVLREADGALLASGEIQTMAGAAAA